MCVGVCVCVFGYPGTHSIDQAGLKVKDSPASASQVLGLKACATTAWLHGPLYQTAFTHNSAGSTSQRM